MKVVSVSAAVIVRESAGGGLEAFATRRGNGEWRGWWEFPGGKVEPGESSEEALRREIREELASEVEVGRLLGEVVHDYPTFRLSMRCYECSLVSGRLELLEHEDAAWLSAERLRSVRWLPADERILGEVGRLLGGGS